MMVSFLAIQCQKRNECALTVNFVSYHCSFHQGARGFPGTPGLPGIKGHRVSQSLLLHVYQISSVTSSNYALHLVVTL